MSEATNPRMCAICNFEIERYILKENPEETVCGACLMELDDDHLSCPLCGEEFGGPNCNCDTEPEVDNG